MFTLPVTAERFLELRPNSPVCTLHLPGGGGRAAATESGCGGRLRA